MTNAKSLPASIVNAIALSVDAALDAALTHFDCQAGTVHWLGADGVLQLAAQRNLPPAIVGIIQTVPVGKGIAGLAAEKCEPVSFCNLQTDDSGRARPAAKTTGMEGSIAVPMLVDGELRGVLGIAKFSAYEWNDDQKASLLHIASLLGEKRPQFSAHDQ